MLARQQVTARLAQDLVDSYGEDVERAAAMEMIGNADAAQIWSTVSEVLARMRGRLDS